mgnify:FL=1
MTLITSTNKYAFKEWMREYRKMFGPEPLISDYMGLVSKFLTSSQSGVTSNKHEKVNIVMWETFDETVDLSGKLRVGEYYYFPALPNDQVKVKNGSTTVTLDFDNDGKIRNKNLGDYVDIGDKRITIRGIGGTLGQAGQGVTYAIAPSATTVNEGVTITFTITTTNIANGTTVYWDTTGGVNAADFTDNAVSGNINVNNNTATFTRTLKNDLSLNQTEGTETFQIRVSDGTNIVATSPTITVNDTSYAGYTVTTSSTTPAEGTTMTVTLSTVGVPNSTYVFLAAIKNDGSNNYMDSSDVGDRWQGVSVFNNTASWNIPITQDLIVDTGEQFNVVARLGNSSGTLVATSPLITIQDTPFSISVTPSTTTANEGETVNFTVNTTGIPNGTTLTWYVVGNSSTDYNDMYHNFTINNNQGTFSISLLQDFIDDPGESFVVRIQSHSGSGATVFATSTTININQVTWTFNITPSVTTIAESTGGQSPVNTTLTLAIATSGIEDGTQLRVWPERVSPSGGDYSGAYDFTTTWDTGNPPWDFTINNNAATLPIKIKGDALTEGTEVWRFRFAPYNNQNVTAGTSPDITITDASFIGSRKTDKTFGPIRVNRDNGNAANVSDWYTICGLDKLPNNSKVAIFIDKSGSMTQSTISASYDLLMSKLQARNMDVITKTDMNEDWIAPFTGIIDDP